MTNDWMLGSLYLLMAIMLVARSAIARLTAPAPSGAAAAGGAQPALPGAAGRPALAAPMARNGSAGVEVEAVDGRVGDELMRRTREVVEQAPEEAVTVIRAWLQEP